MEMENPKEDGYHQMENPKEDGYYQLEKEKGMFPVMHELMPQMTGDAWKELYENGGIAMK